jgi:S1-C subfamily serine protease
VVVWYDAYREVLVGAAHARGALQGGFLDVTSRTGHRRCVGPVRPRIVPPEVDVPSRCDGLVGLGTLSCSDGREIAVEWRSEEICGTGYGQGQDDEGREVHMAYGGSPRRAEAIAEEALAQLESLPALPPRPTGGPGRARGVRTGTAFFVTWDGVLLTNHHVIADAQRVRVRLEGGEMMDAEVVTRDPENDLAVLRVHAISRPLPLRRSNDLTKGQSVYALGYPLVQLQGQEQKATFGRVNALSGLQDDDRYTQIDVPIQPGNSGGPLINHEGEVVGIVTAMLNPMATVQMAGVVPQNVNYALKSDLAHRLLRWNLGADWDAKVGSGSPSDLVMLVERTEGSVAMVVAE